MEKELFDLIPLVDLASEDKIRKFKEWQHQDGSVEGLKKLLSEEKK